MPSTETALRSEQGAEVHLHGLVNLAQELQEAALPGADVAFHAHRQLPRRLAGEDEALILGLAALSQVVCDQLAVPPVPDANIVLQKQAQLLSGPGKKAARTMLV